VNCKRPALVALASFFLGASCLYAQHGGGGGHASGGHSGSGTGHSIGHAVGHVFGRHGGENAKGSSGRDGDGFPAIFGSATNREASSARRFNPSATLALEMERFHRSPAGSSAWSSELLKRRRLSAFARTPFYGFCDFWAGVPRRSLFTGDWDCFGGESFFDPFLFAGFDPYDDGSWNANPNSDVPDSDSLVRGGQLAFQNARSRTPVPKQPDTLLQLTDGSMYGLTAYWLEGDRLRYITDYGGENSLPLSRIDLGKTMELNAARGVRFELVPKRAGE
jgi:hypothetical protein